MFTIHASGADAWGSADAFHYVYRALDGDGTIIARVASQENTNEWAKAGLMVRETLDADAKNVFLFRAPGHGIVAQSRSAAGGGTGGTNDRPASVPASSSWLKLTRQGDRVTASASGDGQSWVLVETATVPMKRIVFIGLAALSHAHGSLNRSLFDNVTLEPK